MLVGEESNFPYKRVTREAGGYITLSELAQMKREVEEDKKPFDSVDPNCNEVYDIAFSMAMEAFYLKLLGVMK